ncbi:MAG: prepilin-type N-terminal cleavage/methylation domain-containing protein [Proteobacteria bacterium]|nr:prepilin-type N-terminal cleavage/methylation domain-containing protein [Pseudomonadota bacterium]
MKRRPRPSQAGFTLLELLIALAITTAVVALVFAGFGVIGRTEERNQRLIDRAERMLVTSQWLGRKMDTLRQLSLQVNGSFVSFFSGNAAGAMWVAPLPERGESGGLYVFRATPLRHDDGSVDLSMEVLPYTGALMQLDWNQAEKAVLLRDLRTLQWHYQDGRTGQWVQQWDNATGFYPSRVKLELADAQGDWPPLVFALARAR